MRWYLPRNHYQELALTVTNLTSPINLSIMVQLTVRKFFSHFASRLNVPVCFVLTSSIRGLLTKWMGMKPVFKFWMFSVTQKMRKLQPKIFNQKRTILVQALNTCNCLELMPQIWCDIIHSILNDDGYEIRLHCAQPITMFILFCCYYTISINFYWTHRNLWLVSEFSQ